MDLPRFIAISNNRNDRYLHRVYNEHQPHANGFLRFSGVEVINPYAKFEVEPAGGENFGLVHIRCCYNNKYWSCRGNQNWIIAEANDKVENRGSEACTLFIPHAAGVNNSFGLRHVFHDQLVRCYLDIESTRNNCLYVGMPMENNIPTDILIYTDWESLPIMPKHIAIKGDNQLYLGVGDEIENDGVYLKFNCENRENMRVRHQVSTTPHGSIRINSNFNGNFWSCIPGGWISPNVANVDNDVDLGTLFQVIRIDNNTITLFNSLNNNFCRRHTENDNIDCLQAGAPDNDILEVTNLHIEELVIRREINNVRFELDCARTNMEVGVLLENRILDNLTQTSQNQTVQFTYTKEENRTWNASVSWKLGINTVIRACIPFIDELLLLQLSDDEVAFEYQWGETMPNIYEVQQSEIELPPMTRTTVSLQATTATCEVPYSYTQCDIVIINDEEVAINEDMHDGLYTFTCICECESTTTVEPI